MSKRRSKAALRARAIEFRDPPDSRSGLGHVVDKEAGHAVVNDFWR